MIDNIVNLARNSHQSKFLRFSKRNLKNVSERVVTPTYQRQRENLIKNESDIEDAVYLNTFRLKANTALRKKSSMLSYGALIAAFAGSIFIIGELWSNHIPMSGIATVKQAVAARLIDKVPEGKMKDRLEGYIEKKKEAGEKIGVRTVTKDAGHAILEKSGIKKAVKGLNERRDQEAGHIVDLKKDL